MPDAPISRDQIVSEKIRSPSANIECTTTTTSSSGETYIDECLVEGTDAMIAGGKRVVFL